MHPTFSRALALHERGAVVEARHAYRMAIRDEPRQAPAAYSNLGMLLNERPAEMLACNEAAVALSPANPDVLYNLANAQMQAGRRAEADHSFRRVLRQRPSHAASYNNLAVLARQAGGDAEALALFRQALACGPDALMPLGGEATVLSNLAGSGLSTLRPEEAVALQRQAVAIAPSDGAIRARLGERLLAVPGRESEAELALRTALHSDPADGHALNALGTLLQAQHGRWREAMQAYHGCLAVLPTLGDAYHNLGTVHQRLGQLAEAETLYSAALLLLPEVPNVYVSLASLSAPPRNVALLERAIELRPADAEVRAPSASSLSAHALARSTVPKPCTTHTSHAPSPRRRSFTCGARRRWRHRLWARLRRPAAPSCGNH